MNLIRLYTRRYEIEYDENRIEIAKDIGRKFLGFESNKQPVNEVSDAGGGGDATMVPKDNHSLNNNVGDSAKDKASIPEVCGDVSLTHCPNGEKDALVLDVLNDELVARVQEKVFSANKELFEPCMMAVKTFLIGEPFKEFEQSMYFYR